MLKTPTRSRRPGVLLGCVLAALLILPAGGASANGGISPDGKRASAKTVPGNKAKLRKGKAIPPANAPRKVKRVIAAANRIRNKPYKYGGGHSRWNDSGYDCSGAASYALHGGGLLKRPIDSNGMARYGKRGRGKWITVFGAPSHGYLVIAGLRFDTSMVRGDGPGWSRSLRSTPENYKVRHPKRL